MKKSSLGAFIFALALPVLVGMVSALISSKGMATYGTMSKPPLSPPAWLFPVAWTVLYIMMGLASYFIIVAEVNSRDKVMPLLLYALQLAINFLWSIIFFNWGMYMFAFVWLIIMWCIVIVCAFMFFSINRLSAYLLIPYIVWLSFAAYLNMGAYILNNVKK